MKSIPSILTTCILAATLAAAGFSSTKIHKPTSLSKSKLTVKGKQITMNKGCVQCHGSDLKGKAHRTPSITASGELKHYNTKTFAIVMDTGITEDGGKLKPPMPVFHMSKSDSSALYTYLNTLK